MLSAEQGTHHVRWAGDAAGELLCRCRLPALIARELPEPDCAPVRVRLLVADRRVA
jgi:hypothetical protein